jgi:mRNA interferase RelE/StbE
MAWKVELSAEADRELGKLDAPQRTGILNFLEGRVAKLDDPRSLGQSRRGSKLGEFWKYRGAPHRLICKIRGRSLDGVGLRIGHRREIYP